VAGVALVTATLMLVAFRPSNMEAVNEGQELGAQIATPKLVARGVELTLVSLDEHIYQAGDRPVFSLNAVNTTGLPAGVSVQIVMTSMALQSALSRVAPRAMPLWQAHHCVTLEPNETRAVPLPSDVRLPANSRINVTLQTAGPAEAGKESILALSFSTAALPLVR